MLMQIAVYITRLLQIIKTTLNMTELSNVLSPYFQVWLGHLSVFNYSAWYLSYPKTYYIIYLYNWFQQYAECCLKHSDKNSSHCKLFTVQRERHGPIPSQFKCSGQKHLFEMLRITIVSRNFPQQQQPDCAPFAQVLSVVVGSVTWGYLPLCLESSGTLSLLLVDSRSGKK